VAFAPVSVPGLRASTHLRMAQEAPPAKLTLPRYFQSTGATWQQEEEEEGGIREETWLYYTRQCMNLRHVV
jgi:hypothetical protein